jgi:hypothetical protein
MGRRSSKAVHWHRIVSMLTGGLARRDLSEAFRYCLPNEKLNVPEMRRNRLERNELMRSFCAQAPAFLSGTSRKRSPPKGKPEPTSTILTTRA